MIKSSSIQIKTIVDERRFNPKYFYFLNKKNELINSSSIKFCTLDDKSYITKLSDGIHTAVGLKNKGTIKYLYVKNLNEGFIDITDNIYLEEDDHAKNISKELHDKDVLLSVVGSLGETAMFSNYLTGKTSLPRNIAFIRTNEDKILPEFLTSFFLSKFSKEQCIYSGGGNIQGLLSLTKLKKFIVPVPDMQVQESFKEKYTKALDLEFKILSSIEDCKKELYKALDINFSKLKFKNSFPASIENIKSNSIWTPSFYDTKPSEILSEIGKKFELKSLGTLTTIKKGNEIGSENYKDYLLKTDLDVPFIRTSDIYNYQINSYPSYYASKDIYYELNQDFKTGDIILNNDGRIGYVSIITSEDKAIYQSHIRRLRTKKEYKNLQSYIFLCLIINEIGGIQFKKNTVIQTTIPTLANRVENIVIPIINDEAIKIISSKMDLVISMIEEKKRIIKLIKCEMNKLINYS
jgi:type I restriction enzyme S subunit